jgi:hypothetical protein
MVPKIKNLLGRRLLAPMLVFLFASAIYLYAFPQPNIFYAVVVLLHAVVGLLATVYLIILLVQLLREASWIARLGWLLVLASAVLGSVLIKIGALRADYDWLYLHIGVALTGCGFLFGDWANWTRRAALRSLFPRARRTHRRRLVFAQCSLDERIPHSKSCRCPGIDE